jgi:hypothetical protein
MMRIALVTGLALFLAVVSPTTAGAVVPNDDQETATEIAGPFPYEAFVDLSEATTSAVEIQQCPHAQNTVWYKHTAGDEDQVLLIAFSPFSHEFQLWGTVTTPTTGGSCFEITPTQLRGVQALAGETVYLSVGSLAGQIPGVVSIYADVRPLIHVDATLSARATVNRAGYAIVTGTVSCDPVGEPPLQSIFVSAYIEQKSGHGFIPGAGTTAVDCTASGPTTWSVEIQPSASGGKFVAGRATVTIEAFISAWRDLGTTDFIGPTTLKVVANPN